MQYIGHTNPKMLIASDGKMLRAVNDVYKPAQENERGDMEPEYFPYTTTTVFLPDNVSEEEAKAMYVEE